jgi:UDPglucose 6-dehydrogenase
MEIIIAGYGFVGKAIHNALKSQIVHVVDPQVNDSEIAHYPMADGIIICVGTPSDMHGGCDDSQIRDVVSKTPIHIPILIKSTVLPDQLLELEKDFPEHSICYSPEFLRASTANQDFLNQKYMIIGGEDPECFWQDLFASELTNCKLFFNCSTTEASMIKYSANSFLAIKTSFFNQIYDMCEQNGADFGVVRQLLSHDSRIGNGHTLVPGPDGRRGWGGHCLPKDTTAFIKYSYDLNTPITVLKESVEYNNKIR